MRKLLFVFNPNSGKGQMKNRLLDIVKIFAEGDFEITVHPTKAPNDGYEYILDNGERFDIICCSGGDGTLNETVGAVMQLNEKCGKSLPIGYIPSGTTNDFAVSLGIPKDMLKAAHVVADGKLFACDIGLARTKDYVRNFNYVAAFGAFTEVSYATPQELKNALGHQAYIIEGMRSLSELKPQYLRVKMYIKKDVDKSAEYELGMISERDAADESGAANEGGTAEVSVAASVRGAADRAVREVEGSFLYGMVSNTKSVGGMKGITGKNVDLCDGLFEVTLVREITNPVDLHQAVGGLITQDYSNNAVIESFQTDHIEFESAQEVAWTFDGEFGGSHTNIVFDVKPHAVDFIVRK